jgi:hypothetical protein
MSYNNSDSFRNTLKYQGPDYAYVPLYYRSRDPNSPTDASNDIRPKEQQGYYLIGSIWMNTANGNCWRINQIYSLNGVTVANWELQSSNEGTVTTLSDNSTPPGNAYVDPLDGNIQFTGEVVNQFNFFPTVVSNPTNHSIAINPMSSARWIVDGLSGGKNGTSTTIAGAISKASPGDTIAIVAGTYTENLTFPAGLSFTGLDGDGFNENVSITGNHTYSGNGTLSFSNINFNSNATATFVISGSSNSSIDFNDCQFTVNNNITAIANSSPGVIVLTNCTCLINASAGRWFNNTGTGGFVFSLCSLSNGGLSTFTNACSSGFVNANFSRFNLPMSFISTGSGTWEYCLLFSNNINVVSLALTSSGFLSFKYCRLISGTASCVTTNAAVGVEFLYCNFLSNAVSGNAISGGAGAISYSGSAFLGSAVGVSAGSQTPDPTGPVIALAPFSGSLTANILCGNGSPNGVIIAPISSLYLRTDASSATTRIYVNTDGGTTWTNVTCAA